MINWSYSVVWVEGLSFISPKIFVSKSSIFLSFDLRIDGQKRSSLCSRAFVKTQSFLYLGWINGVLITLQAWRPHF